MKFIDWLLIMVDLYFIVFKHSIVFVSTIGFKLISGFDPPKITIYTALCQCCSLA